MKGLDDLGLKHNILKELFIYSSIFLNSVMKKDTEFCEDLVRKVGVGSVPGSTFFC